MRLPKCNPVAGAVPVEEWLDARALGITLKVSERTLCRWRKAGLLKPGIHWRRKFPSAN